MTTRILLAGATGAIGRRLVPQLVGAGHDVAGITRRDEAVPELRALGAEGVVADALDGSSMLAAMARVRPDVVIHQLTDLGGGTSATNAALRLHGTRNLVDAARLTGVRRIVAQSIAWAYEPGEAPASEDLPLDLAAAMPRRMTIEGIAALEATVRELPEWVVLRYGLFYGPGTWYAPDGRFAEQARTGTLTAGEDVSSFVHVDDAADAAAAALAWPSGAVNVCDDEPAPGRDWVPAFCDSVGAGVPPADDAPRAGWARGASNRHAREALGWAPRHASWRTGFGVISEAGSPASPACAAR